MEDWAKRLDMFLEFAEAIRSFHPIREQARSYINFRTRHFEELPDFPQLIPVQHPI